VNPGQSDRIFYVKLAESLYYVIYIYLIKVDSTKILILFGYHFTKKHSNLFCSI
jgi:hypothetical protein